MTDAGYRLRHRQIASPQFFCVWQLVEIAQTEVIEEKLCRFVKERSPRDFGASGDFHQTALHQRLQHAIDVHAAHRFYVRPRNRLAIRNDRQCLQRRRAQSRRLRRREKLPDPFRKAWIGSQLPAFCFFDQLKRAALLNVFDL